MNTDQIIMQDTDEFWLLLQVHPRLNDQHSPVACWDGSERVVYVRDGNVIRRRVIDHDGAPLVEGGQGHDADDIIDSTEVVLWAAVIGGIIMAIVMLF